MIGCSNRLLLSLRKEFSATSRRIMSSATTTGQEVTKQRKSIMVFGGNGYVGQGIVSAALSKGIDVLSISRSGAPANFETSIKMNGADVQWLKGDINQPDTYKEALKTVDAAVSCVGAFGSNDFMERVNGDANIAAIKTAQQQGVPRFVYISTVDNNLPDFVLKGYFHGKRRAEKALAEAFPDTGVILRPGFIYGTRDVSLNGRSVGIPLWLLGQPLSVITETKPLRCLRDRIPGMKAILSTPISRDSLGKVVVEAALGNVAVNSPDRVVNVEQLIDEARKIE